MKTHSFLGFRYNYGHYIHMYNMTFERSTEKSMAVAIANKEYK